MITAWVSTSHLIRNSRRCYSVHMSKKSRICANRIYRRLIPSVAIVLSAVTVCGCGQTDMPELTEEQTELVTEYAAGLILKYDITNPGDDLLSPEQLAKLEEEERIKREKERAAKAAAEEYLAKKANADKEKKEQKSSDGSDNNSSGGSQSNDQAVGDLAQFYGMSDFSISYAGYELTDSYPSSGEDMLMAMDATAGKTLCVLKFNVTNNSAAQATFDMFYRNPSFFLTIDGGEKVHQQYTLLLNDMAASNDPFEPGQTLERVLIFEVPDSVQSVGTMSLQAKNQEGVKGTMNLQ